MVRVVPSVRERVRVRVRVRVRESMDAGCARR
jgi:hypothetical protein